MKKVLKSILSLILAASLCVGMSVAVSAADAAPDEQTLNEILELLNSLSTETVEDTGTEDAGTEDGQEPAAAPAAAPAEGAIDATETEEVVLLDDDLCTVTMKKFAVPEDDWYGFSAKVFVENKSDVNIWVQAENVCLNGYVIDPYWSASVASGHKSNSEMTFYASDLEANGITDISELSFRLEIDDDDTYDDLEMADFTILPFGKDAPAQPAPEFGDDAMVLVDNDDFCLIITGEPVATDYYLSLPVYIENRTDINIHFSTYGSSAINGYEISPSLYATVPAGKRMNTELSWSISDLEDNDIEEIEDVELDLTVEDNDDWYADPVFDEMVYFSMN